mmetsp:Transcript_36297/g.83711  ORF Transcript_36297/g.83711 Transcript_36297/m.83711 type:complete len:236 (-) Transcript_36297:223-930(-)
MEALLGQGRAAVVHKNIRQVSSLRDSMTRLLWDIEKKVIAFSMPQLVKPLNHLFLFDEGIWKVPNHQCSGSPLRRGSSNLSGTVQSSFCPVPNFFGHLCHFVWSEVRTANAPAVRILLGQVPKLDKIFCEALHVRWTYVQLVVVVDNLCVVELGSEICGHVGCSEVYEGRRALPAAGFLCRKPQQHIVEISVAEAVNEVHDLLLVEFQRQVLYQERCYRLWKRRLLLGLWCLLSR